MAVIVRLTGFSGHIIIDGVQILSGNSSFSTEQSPNFINYADIRRDFTQRNRVLYAPGTRVTTGSASFDVTAAMLTNLLTTLKLFKRNYSFTSYIFDGNLGKKLENCYITSLSLNGSIGGLINGSMSFISNKDPVSYDGSLGAFQNPETTVPYGYWYSGNTINQISEWSFDYSQNVVPVHLNQIDDPDNELPRYLRVGLQNYSLRLTTYDEIDPATNQIIVATRSFLITGTRTGNTYNFNGPNNFGNFSHEFQSSAVTSPNEDVLS